MKCELAQETIVMAVYGELPDDKAPEFEQHLAGCERCREEVEAVKALSKVMSLLPIEEPSANLVARSRLRLEEALDAIPRGSWLVRSWRRFGQSIGRLRGAPAAACAVVVASLTVGGVSGFEAGQRSPEVVPAAQTQHPDTDDDSLSDVAYVSSIVQKPNSENVQVVYNRLQPVTVTGSLDDPKIRQLLLLGTRNRLNPNVQDSSVRLLADECRAGHECDDGPVRDALLKALRYDKSATVRLKALEGLQPYVADDVRVRDTVLESLLSDPDPRVRTQAIGLLEPVGADSSVREVLHTVAARDDNPDIRSASRQVLDQIPQVQ
ncbi:MAG: HEAT repeat domain-containing protein [Silvibacterium sp.]|nr:HEAT repeat domain-containing protein [Silvibacterium sp.]MBV8436404.1 HEAT repeat domain-containing protein [Silvibacterium sp.]